MAYPVCNPPNPWHSSHVDWLDDPPAAKLELFEESAKSILASNDSPDIGFRYSVNPYRGCIHACAYCLVGHTPILMANGRTRALSELAIGDEIVGTEQRGHYRRYVTTRVLAHWSTVKPGFRVSLEDGTQLIASGDHRFLTERGWKHVIGEGHGPMCRPHLTTNNALLGTGAFAAPPIDDVDYRRGYLCGMVRGDGLLATYDYSGRRRGIDRQYQFRLALVDLEALQRSRHYLLDFGVDTAEYVFQRAVAGRKPITAIRTSVRSQVERIGELIAWPSTASIGWRKGFLAGIFDAEGSYSDGCVRIANADAGIIDRTVDCLRHFGFDSVVDNTGQSPVRYVRIRGGLAAHLRFFHTVDPAVTRRRTIDGQTIKHATNLRVFMIEPLRESLPMFDITTGTGDFIANGVVSHNCYARPSHQYLDWGAGTDFDRKIVVKVNAPEKLREAFSRKTWQGELVAFSGNTDCYQPIEASYELTRRCLEVCHEFRNPISVITKSRLVRRDAELLARIARDARASVSLSIPFARDEMAHVIEPWASLPSKRFEALRALSEAGVPTGVAIAPIIPGLNESDIPEILERAHAAGARRAFMILLRLPAQVLPVFRERIRVALPAERVARIERAIAEVRGGKLSESRFHARHCGTGTRWKVIESMFEQTCRRFGMNVQPVDQSPSTFRRPRAQLTLW